MSISNSYDNVHPSYNSRNFVTKRTDGEGTWYEYDWYGNQIRIFYADVGCERRFYDSDGNLIKQVMPEAYDPETDDGAGYTYSYDPMGRLSRVEYPDGNMTHSYRYNGHGQTVWEADGEGTEHFYEYNGLGLKSRDRVSIRKEKDVVFYHVTSYEYDLQGNKVEEAYGQEEVAGDKDPETWHRIGFAYDEEGICRHVRYSYNKNGWRVKKEERIQGNGKEVTSAVTCYGYDKAGNLTKITTPNGYEIRRAYDGDGRLTEERIIDRPNGIGRRESYTYDAAGNLLSETLEGREGEAIRREYEYDLMGRTSRIFNGQGMEVRYRYDSQDRIREINYGKHVVTQYDYDGDGNVSRLETTAGEDILLSFCYEYDGNGNRTAKYGEQAIAYGGKQKVRTSYRYDIRGQLVEEKDHDSPTSYTYDAAGNRTGKKTPERVTRYSYNGKDQLTEETWDTGKNIFTYDRQGSILEITGTEGSRHFTYNSKNQQLKVDCEDGRSQENLYDAEGLRYGMKENSTYTRFVYHRGELLYEGSDEKEVSYHLGSGIEAAQMGGEEYYYHQDEQLSITLLTDDTGRIKNYYRYNTFGSILVEEESVSNRIRYTGQQYDGMSGQYYLRARYYNPIVGRFLQEDMYEGDGLNLYAYCRNNPVMYYDPSGYTSTGTGGYEIGAFGGDEGESTELDTGNWNKGSFDTEEDSLRSHFDKHKDEVNAKTPEEYLRKAEEFARTAKKGSSKSRVSGAVEGVIRYKKNGKYIDLVPDGSIISFGRQ